MMKQWQYDMLFFVGVGGTLLLLFGPSLGLEIESDNPLTYTGIGAILTFVLTQRKALVKDKSNDEET